MSQRSESRSAKAEFVVVLAAHLDQEEAEMLPLLGAHISASEWRTMGDAAFARFTNDEKLIALGQMLDVSSEEEAKPFLRSLPPPVRWMWRLVGRRRYDRYMRAVSGSPR